MNEPVFFNSLLIGWLVLATAIFLALFFVAAPYGPPLPKWLGTCHR